VAAGRRLEELLAGPYRRRWQFHAQRQREGRLNQLAVATVLTGYLSTFPQRDGDVDKEPKQLLDTVWRVVHDKGLSYDRLLLFIDAFNMSEQHAEELIALWLGLEATLGDYHTQTWPAAQKSAVWVFARSTLQRAGERDVLRFAWGPWRLLLAVRLGDRGVAFTTDKDADKGEPARLSVGCDNPIYVQFGEHRPPEGVPTTRDTYGRWPPGALGREHRQGLFPAVPGSGGVERHSLGHQ
jgi:hypothetical protein